jgi:hypothetical protein
MNFVIFVIIPALICVSLVIMRFCVHMKEYRPLIGYLYGLTPIIVAWVWAERLVISACKRCPEWDTLCCEWTGVGIVVYTVLALASILVYSVLAFLAEYMRRQ